MTVSFDKRLVVPADVLMQELEGESVFLNLKTERYFGLDGVGTRVWTVLSQAVSIQAAYDALLAEYDVEPEKLRADLVDLIDRLLVHGLMEVAGAKVA
jgi:hypothetical protein